MPACERCGKGEAEWRCQVCGKIVCENCARPTDKGVFCADHVPIEKPRGEVKKKREISAGAKAIKSIFIVMLVLTLGLGLIVSIGEVFISMVGIPTDAGPAQGIIDIIIRVKGSGTLILVGMAIITALLGIAYIGARRAG